MVRHEISIALAADIIDLFAQYHIHPQEAWNAIETVQETIKSRSNLLPEEVKKECTFLNGGRKIGFAK